MSIVYGALVPHAPFLLTDEADQQLPNTKKGIKAVKQGLLASNPDVLFVINSHEPTEEDVFLLNVHPRADLDFSDFGIKEPFRSWNGNMELSSHLRHVAQEKKLTIQQTTEPITLATAIPLALFSELPESATFISFHTSGKSAKEHEKIATFLNHEIVESENRVAVICSANLSSTGDKAHPERYRPEGQTYNDLAIDAISGVTLKGLRALEESLIGAASTCAHEPLITYLSLMSQHTKKGELLSKELFEGTLFVTASHNI